MQDAAVYSKQGPFVIGRAKRTEMDAKMLLNKHQKRGCGQDLATLIFFEENTNLPNSVQFSECLRKSQNTIFYLFIEQFNYVFYKCYFPMLWSGAMHII